MAFPSSPTLNQIAVEGGRTYQWDGYAWSLANNVAGHAATHSAGAADALTLTAAQVSDFATVARSSVGAYGKTLLFG